MHSHTLFNPAPALLTSRIRPLALALVAAMGLLLSTTLPALAQCLLSFPAPANYAAGANPSFVAVGDFNADGQPDLAIANTNSNNVSILLGNVPPNAGTFLPAVNYAAGSSPLSVKVGDFNSDGRPDLAVANFGSNKVSILLGNAPPNAKTFQAPVNYSVRNYPVSVAVGDFNADGRPDLAVANQGSHNVSILQGNLSGTFQAAVNYAVGSNQPISFAVGDFNADGRPDLAVANVSSNNVSVLLNTTLNFPAPTITQQPIAQAVLSGSMVMFTAPATSPAGTGTLSHQWRSNGVNMAKVSGVSHALTPILIITAATLADNGSGSDCIVSNACGSTPSNPAGLAVATILCLADGLDTIYNPNGSVGPKDLAAFINGC